jgi:chitinase
VGGNAGAAGAGGASTPSHWVMGYYAGYQRGQYPPSDVAYGAMTHIAIGALLPKGDGSLDTDFYQGTGQGPALVDDLTQRAHAAGTKVILMLGGAGTHDAFAQAASAGNRATFVKNLVDFSKAHGADGLDLDWEPLPSSELDSFDALAKAIRAAWPEVILTVPIGPLNPNYETADAKLAAISASFDQINIMTYGMAGPYQGWQSWHSSALDGETSSTPTSVSSSVDLYLAGGIPASKLGVGIGFYGICYGSPVTGPNQALGNASFTGDDNTMSYVDIVGTYMPGTTPKWDAAAKVPYLSFSSEKGPAGCRYVSYEDEASIAEKGAYVKSKGLGGTIIWTIGEGHLASAPAGQRDPLLQATHDSFQ